MHETKVIQ